jgi:ABC-type spermidine/putrescine transport system permease subunit I
VTSGRRSVYLFIPIVVVFTGLFLLPMTGLLVESFRLYVPGSVGSAANAPFTLANYAELITPAFAGFFFETIRIGFLASLLGIIFAFPLAYWMTRNVSPRWRAIAVGFFVTLMFLSVLVRTYALELTFGAAGPLRPILLSLGISPNSRGYIETLVGAGLLHYIVPMATLTLLGTIQNVDPRLFDAAQALGATRWKAHLSITLPLHARPFGSLSFCFYIFNQRFRHPDDPRQGTRVIRVKPGLQPFQRDCGLSQRCGDFRRAIFGRACHGLCFVKPNQ